MIRVWRFPSGFMAAIKFKVLFHGTDLEGETAKWESVVGYWLEMKVF